MGIGPVETLARYVLQSELYRSDMDVRDAVDSVLGSPIYDTAPAMHDVLARLTDGFERGAETTIELNPDQTNEILDLLSKAQGEA